MEKENDRVGSGVLLIVLPRDMDLLPTSSISILLLCNVEDEERSSSKECLADSIEATDIRCTINSVEACKATVLRRRGTSCMS